MNFRTTAILAILLAGMVVGYTLLRQSPAITESETPVPKMPAADVAAPLIEDEALGEVQRITVRKDDGAAWTFEKEEGTAPAGSGWKITDPFTAKASGWEVDRIARDLKGIKYEVSHPIGAAGSITPADAGLEPPQFSIQMTDNGGKTKTVQIGKPASQTETYVRLEGGDRIAVAKSNLRTLVKKSAVEYRDMQLWTIAPENVRRVEIEDRAADGGPQKYVFVRDGARWSMEAPAKAQATAKVNEAVQAISRLRVAKWHDETEAKPTVVGLEPAALTFRITVEEQVPVEKKSDEATPDGEGDAGEANEDQPLPTELKTTVYELHVSKLSPIGEDTKAYVRVGQESAIGTILKTTTDKLKPVMNEWREMRVTTAPVDQASRIDLTVGDERAALLKTGDGWKFESGEKADDTEVNALLTSIKNLNATTFVESGEQAPANSGLAPPQAEVVLTIPGSEGVERLAIGGFTDEAARRLRYARRGEGTLAKVRAGDVDSLLRVPAAYRDRAVLNVAADAVQRITVRKPSGIGDAEISATFARTAAGWEMVEPVTAPAAIETLNGLVTSLAQLRATGVMADGADLATFGLDKPAVTISLAVASIPPAEGAETPAPQTIELSLGQRDAKVFAKRGDRPAIYEVSLDVLSQARSELRSGKLFDFDTAAVSKFSIQQGTAAFTFVRKDSSTWTYAAEPDLPLNSTKVENLLLQIKDMQTPAYIAHSAADLAAFGLHEPSRQFIVTTGDGRELELLVSDRPADLPGGSGSMGTIGPDHPVFILTEDSLRRLQVNLEELEAA